jgi:hypothetical protein
MYFRPLRHHLWLHPQCLLSKVETLFFCSPPKPGEEEADTTATADISALAHARLTTLIGRKAVCCCSTLPIRGGGHKSASSPRQLVFLFRVTMPYHALYAQ